MSTQNIEVVTGSEVALRCDVPDANKQSHQASTSHQALL